MLRIIIVPFFLLLSMLPGKSQNLSSSLTACYSLNSNANEVINSLNGTLTAVTPTVDRFNAPGSSLAFSGTSSSYVLLPNSAFLKPTPAISVSGWYRLSSLNVQMIAVFAKNVYTSYFTAYSLTIQDNGSGYRFRVYRQDGVGSDFVDGNTIVSPNIWYHVVFSISSNVMSIYVDGVLENSVGTFITSFNYDPTRGVVLGGTNETNYNDPYEGTIDNLRFYNRMLTSAEVNALYIQDPVCAAAAQPPVASFPVSSVKVCAGGSVVLTDLSSNNPTAWSWNIPGAVTGNSAVSNPTFTFANPGVYTASLTVSNGGGTSTNTATQSIVVVPKPSVTAATTKTLFCPGENIVITANGALTYSWSSSQTGAVLTVPAFPPGGFLSYTVTGTDNNGCANTATVKVMVSVECVGLEENNRQDLFAVYPNPSQGMFAIFSSEEQVTGFRLMNAVGQVLRFENSLRDSKISVDIQELPPGIYMLRVNTTTGVQSGKVIRE
jgi:PKD repeat protein